MLDSITRLFPSRDRRTARRRLGDQGEHAARGYLVGRGYRLVASNVVVQLPRGAATRAILGEIDVVAYDGSTLVFVEVKTRRREGQLAPERAVDARKRRVLIRSAARYRRMLGLSGEPYRFDVVTVLLVSGRAPLVRLRRDYFRGHTNQPRTVFP